MHVYKTIFEYHWTSESYGTLQTSKQMIFYTAFKDVFVAKNFQQHRHQYPKPNNLKSLFN